MLTARELCEGMAQTFIDPPLTSDADADLTSGHFKEWTIMDLINSRPTSTPSFVVGCPCLTTSSTFSLPSRWRSIRCTLR